MNNPNNIFLTVHQFDEAGNVNSMQYEEDVVTQEVIAKIPISTEDITLTPQTNWNFIPENKVNLSYRYLEPEDSSVTIIKIGAVEDLNPLNYATEISTVLNDPGDCKSFLNNISIVKPKQQSKIPNIPIMIRCQNCDTNFPTKYQYQRHQCEFNAEKVVLKPDADVRDIDKGMRIKYDCTTCGKQFVSKNNLERHQTSHKNTKENVCEHCKKQFVSENRLRIHIENHCKKAGDISKFYRSDVTVWKCTRCTQVFATPAFANKHSETCNYKTFSEGGDNRKLQVTNNNLEVCLQNFEGQKSVRNMNSESSNVEDDNCQLNIEKILTEILLQCEFCNRTYAEKNALLSHQKLHDTSTNYGCSTCDETFESYIVACKHWMSQCSDKANLFYLPKMTYCEYCDRTFKSHELLYNHKIKKKHYTAKMFNSKDVKIQMNENEKTKQLRDENFNCEKFLEDKDSLVKLIENVLTTMTKVSEENKIDKIIDTSQDNKENQLEILENGTVQVKQEVIVNENGQNDDADNVKINDNNNNEPEKKKRGRKRKWPKQGKIKKPSFDLEECYRYQCERCNDVFRSVADLDDHREKQHASSFSCDECGQVVHSAKALVIHSRAHQSLKPYVCEQCGRSYSQTSHLWQHMRFHQGIKPFACPHEGCEARYTIRPDLKDHIRKVHTRERPFKCAVCNKCFLTGSVYYQHRLIHTNDRRYGCDICEKRFFRADALNNHRRIHTDERPFPCEICGREFRQKGDRNKHVRTQHPD
ncbi:zinc finger protein Xfin-like isoform X2 [Agrilus planipennis]|uniref:Zinc finger protein Xfin-like isoform X2 n=1 Tax=Agrilus planipennis TaxID=224129 RepID=A0A1W4WYJ5_AGRPL|nr:zinc finger protein Xfin-like isoform X2 [Agrilus planipennis]